MNWILHRLIKILRINLFLPFYHAVGNTQPSHLMHLYSIRSKEVFEQDLQLFLSLFKPNALEKALAQKDKNQFSLSFDDGLREFRENAWPILKKYNIPVTLFVNPEFVDNKKMFYRHKASLLMEHVNTCKEIPYDAVNKVLKENIRSKKKLLNGIKDINYGNSSKLDELAKILSISFKKYLIENKPYLTLEELKQLNAEGLAIGAHSMDHPIFNELPLQDQIKQTEASILWVQKHFPNQPLFFSFPFTNYGVSGQFYEQIFYSNGLDLKATFGTAGIKNSSIINNYERLPMDDKLYSAKFILLKEMLYYLLKVPFFKNTIRVK